MVCLTLSCQECSTVTQQGNKWWLWCGCWHVNSYGSTTHLHACILWLCVACTCTPVLKVRGNNSLITSAAQSNGLTVIVVISCVVQIQMMTWSEVVHRIVLVQRTTRLCVVRDLSEHDIVGRIMRKENYLIGMLNAGVLALHVPACCGMRRRFMLTKTLEWNLYWCILDSMFDEHFHIRQVSGAGEVCCICMEATFYACVGGVSKK